MGAYSITGAVLTAASLPVALQSITFRLVGDPFPGDTGTIAPSSVVAVTDAAGALPAGFALQTPTAGSVEYSVTIGGLGITRIVISGTGSATLASLVGQTYVAPTPSALASHAATVASTTQLGHVQIDGTTVTISNGVISAVGGGGGGAPSGPAGGVLGGTYPNPGFAVDMATQAELDAHAVITTAAHGGIVASSDTRLTNARTPTAHTHPAIDLSDSTAAGRGLVTAADATAQRTALGLGALATMTTITASLLSDASANGRSVLTAATYTAMRTLLTLVPGTDIQAWDADLDALAALATTGFAKRTGANTWTAAALVVADIPTLTLSKISDAGTAAAANTGTSAANVPTTAQADARYQGRTRVTFTNADYTAAATDRIIDQIGTLTLPRTVTLPAASAVTAGQHLIIADASGSVTDTNTITIQRAGADTINGATSTIIRGARGVMRLWSDGVSGWIVEQITLSRGGTGADLSATGGASQLLRQSTAGGIVTVSALVAGDLPSHTHTAANISDSTAPGRTLLTAATLAAQQAALGLSSAAYTATTAYEAAGAVATHAALTTSAHGITATGASLTTAADVNAAKSALKTGFASIVVLVIDSPVGSITWATMPLGLTEFNGASRARLRYDMTNATEARMQVMVVTGNASVNTPQLGVQYSADSGTTWAYLDGSASPVASVFTGANALVVSSWITLVAAARADVLLRVVGLGGNGAASTIISYVTLHVR